MKKFLATLMALCVICTGGLGLISASALSDTSSNETYKEDTGSRASDDIDSISYTLSTSKYGADITLRKICSGIVYLELQKKNGSNWDYIDSTSWPFTNKPSTSGSKSYTITQSGTYRLYIKITIDGVATTRNSSEYNF